MRVKILIFFMLIAGWNMYAANQNVKNVKQMVEAITFPDNPQVRETVTRYDRQGRIGEVEFTVRRESGKTETFMETYVYSGDGRTAEVSQSRPDRAQGVKERISFDANGRKTQIVSYDTDGTDFYRTTFKYDGEGSLVQVSHYPNSNENTVTSYVYDKTGRLIADDTRVLDGDYSVGKSTYMYDKRGLLTVLKTEEIPFEGSGTTHVYGYDDKGLLVEDRYYRVEGMKEILVQTARYSYAFY
jgi:hypothetical protein